MNLSPVFLSEGGHLTSREFLSVVGRLQFAEAQVMGRTVWANWHWVVFERGCLSNVSWWLVSCLKSFDFWLKGFGVRSLERFLCLWTQSQFLSSLMGLAKQTATLWGACWCFLTTLALVSSEPMFLDPLLINGFLLWSILLGPSRPMPWWLPDLSGINIWLAKGVFIFVTTMAQWMLLSKALRATLTFGSYFCASRSWSAMVLTGLGSLGSLLRAIALMTRVELDRCLDVSYKVPSVADVCVLSLVWNFQILWAQHDLVKWGWIRWCVSPPLLVQKVRRLFERVSLWDVIGWRYKLRFLRKTCACLILSCLSFGGKHD